MIRLVPLLLLVLASACLPPDRPRNPNADVEDWIRLFDGETLDGWTPKIRGESPGADSLGTFAVVDGAIAVDYARYGAFDERFGHLFYDTPYSYYLLNVVYRFTGNQLPDGPGWAFRNSGVMLHGQAPSMMGREIGRAHV